MARGLLCHLAVILLARGLGLPWFAAPVLALGAAHVSFVAIEQYRDRADQHPALTGGRNSLSQE